MALRELNLVVDKDSGRLVQSFTSTLQLSPLKFVIGDSIPVNVRVVTADPESVWKEVDLTDQSLRLAIGTPAGSPTGGTWTITYGGDTTAALDYNATAAEVETALDALASITSAGGVTVTKSTNGAYRISFDSVGTRTDFSTDLAALYPSSESTVVEAATGDGSTKEIVLIKLETQPAAYIELTTAFPTAAATVTTVRAGAASVSEIQTLELDPVPYAGTFTIDIDGEETGAIAYNASNAVLKAALEALPSIGSGKVTVTGSFPAWTVEFDASLTNVDEMDPDVTGLTVPTGLRGEINTNTSGIIELLDGATQSKATFEVEIYDTVASTAFTVVQTTCTVVDDVIGNTPTSQTPLPTYLTSESSTSTGGNGSSDAGKVVAFDTNGGFAAKTSSTASSAFTATADTAGANYAITVTCDGGLAAVQIGSSNGAAGLVVSNTGNSGFVNVFSASGDNENNFFAMREDGSWGITTAVAENLHDALNTTTTVASLPAAGTAGRRRFVTDANATTFASIVAGSGSNAVPVYDDGTNWRIG